MRACLVLGLASALFAQAPVDPTAVLAEARDKAINRTARLPNYTCDQTVNRQYFKRKHPPDPLRMPSCDQLNGEKHRGAEKMELEATDRLRLDVKVSNGVEIGSWAGAPQFDQRSIMDLVSGPFGTGPFLGFSDIFSNGSVSFQYLGGANGHHEYAFQVPENSSHYFTRAGNEWVATGYDGTFWVDSTSFELTRLSVRSGQLSEESSGCEATSTIDYHRIKIGSGEFLLPRSSVLHFLMKDSRETENVTTYSGCREYHSESTIRFEGEPAPQPDLPKAVWPSLVLPAVFIPAGLSLTLSLVTPIDTNIAAAGDVVLEKVVQPVVDPDSGQVLIPAGATVRARIVKMEYWTGSPAHFAIAVLLESVDISGVASPLYARQYLRRIDPRSSAMRSRGVPILLPPLNQRNNVGTFTFLSPTKGRYVVPVGYESGWVTDVASASR